MTLFSNYVFLIIIYLYTVYMIIMALNVNALTKIILMWLKDWEKWFWKLQVNVSDEIWSYINSDVKEWALCSESTCSEISDLDSQAALYIQLSAVNQKLFENVWQFFDQDVKYYSCQHDQLLAAWAHIIFMILKVKKNILDLKLSVWQWIENFRNNMQLSKKFMLKNARTCYWNIFWSFKINKLFQWLDE